MHAHACAHTQWQTSQCEPLLFYVARPRKPWAPGCCWEWRMITHLTDTHTHARTLSARVLVRQKNGRMGWRVSLAIALLLSCIHSSFLAITNFSKKDNYSWFHPLCIYSSAYFLALWRNEDPFWFRFFLAKGALKACLLFLSICEAMLVYHNMLILYVNDNLWESSLIYQYHYHWNKAWIHPLLLWLSCFPLSLPYSFRYLFLCLFVLFWGFCLFF